jgi:hypothetical protein
LGERIPFAEAIEEPLLFKKAFESLSVQQGMILKAIYGLELNEEERSYWNAFHGFGRFDELGYLLEVTGEFPYEPQEYEDITLVVGRRSGKSERISSFAVAYEALLGGHRGELANKKQDPIFLQVAQDLATAKANLRQFIVPWIESSPIGKRELEKGSQTADMVRLSTGLITVGPPTIKLRGQAIAVCAMDELAFWPKDKESANPDVEVEAAVRPAQSQFTYRKLIKTSTPWTEEGLLFEAYRVGTKGRFLRSSTSQSAASSMLVLKAPTASMGNPKVPKSYLVQEQKRDANAFSREFLAEFAKSATGFLSAPLLRAAVAPGVRIRPPKARVIYVATMDPAFRRDAFAFSIGHMEGGEFVLDYLDAPRGSKDAPLSPEVRIASIAEICKAYGVKMVTTDQYFDVSMMELGQQYGIVIEPFYLTMKLKNQIWGEFVGMLNQGKIQLLDNYDLLEELMKMEKVLTPAGGTQIHGKKDDMATVVALALHKALQFGEKSAAPEIKPESLVAQARKNVLKRISSGGRSSAWWN